MQDKWKPATKVIHAGHIKDSSGALVSPLCQSATFVFDTAEQGAARFAGDEAGYIYTRLGNPTTAELERKMAVLEGAEAATATASGMAAVSSALLANLGQGDHLVASKAVYGCTFSLMTSQLAKFGIRVTLVDFNDLSAVAETITPATKVIFCETPVNPHLDVFDLDGIADIAKQHGLISIVDNTFMTPLLQRPLSHGIDIVIHSATKYLNGHGDVIAGMRVQGRLRTPEISVFSTPSMPENEVMSYLLFGRVIRDTSFGLNEFTQPGSGDSGSLSYGSYLSPKLYVNYVTGLLTPTSVVRVRFQVADHWELHTESSSTHRAADAVFTFER